MMNEIRGTLILADNVYRTENGKWIISGTYSYWQTTQDVLVIPMLATYVRLQFERFGVYRCRVAVTDKMAPPHQPPVINTQFDVTINEATPRMFEAGLQLPEIRQRGPIPLADRLPGSATKMSLLISLSCNDHDIASNDLDLVFCGPPLPATT